METAIQIQDYIQVPIMVWYHPVGGNRILSQLVALGENQININGASSLPEGHSLRIEMQLPMFYPKLTPVDGRILKCEEKIPDTLYNLEVLYQPSNEQAGREIAEFMSALKQKASTKTVPSKPAAPDEPQKPDYPLLSQEQFQALCRNLGDPSKIAYSRFGIHIDGIVLLEDETLPVVATAVGPAGIVFSADERFFMNSSVQLQAPFPTNPVLTSGRYAITGSPRGTELELIIKKIDSSGSLAHAYQAAWGVLSIPARQDIQVFLFTLIQQEYGRDQLKSWLDAISAQEPAAAGGAEKRNFERVPTHLDATLFDEIAFEQEQGEILDLSPGGARVRLPCVFQPGHKLILRFMYNKETFRLAAQSRWVQNVENKDQHITGIEFTITQPEDKRRLQQLIQNLSKG